MPATISAEAHLFLSKGRAKTSLDYLSRLLLLGADPFRDSVLEGLEGKESLIYVSQCRTSLVLPKRPLRLLLPSIAKGLVRLLMPSSKPIVRLGKNEELHFFTRQRKVRWQIRLATRRHFVFRLGLKEFFVVTRLRIENGKKEIWIGVLGRKKKRMARRRPIGRQLASSS
jgi:hypothetical protein